MVLEAARRAAFRPLASRPRHGIAEGAHLPFADGAFDAVYTHRVLQHVTHPAEVLNEMVRVTRRGGRVAAVDCDWGTLTVDAADTTLERRVVSALQHLIANPHAGRQLPRLFDGCRIADLTVEVLAVRWRDYDTFRHTTLSLPNVEARLVETGHVSAHELTGFLDGLAAADRRGQFFATATLVVVAGTVPSRMTVHGSEDGQCAAAS
jgi:SAM-dependent methyltransferase